MRRIAKGVYALPDAPPDVVLAVRLSAELGCLSALQHLKLPLPRPLGIPHLAVPHNFTPGAHGPMRARIHYQHRRTVPGAVASAADALDCAGACLDEVWHLAAVDSALHRGLITLGDVMDFSRCPVARRDFLIRYADARSEAPGETVARLQLVRAGLKVRPQAYVDGSGRVDMEVDDLLVVQVDGYGPHDRASAFRRDREKIRAVVKAGRPQLSYAASELVGHAPVNVAHDAQQALTEWRARDPGRIRPSGTRTLTVPRD